MTTDTKIKATEPRTPKRSLPQWTYKVAIVFATMIWGLSFVVMKNTVDTITPAWLLGIRFFVGGVVLTLFILPRMKACFNKDYLVKGFIIGLLIFLAFWAQTVGLVDTTPGKNAFITATYCVMVPFGWWLIAKLKPSIFNVTAAVLCILGLGFVSLEGSLQELYVSIGDAWTFVGAILFAIHIIYVAKFSEGRDIFVLTAWQFIFGGLIAFVCGIVLEPVPNFAGMSADFWFNMVYLIFLSSLLALLIQNVALAHVSPAQASLLLSLESVFGVAASVLLYGETLTGKLVVGFVLIFVAIVISETGASLFKTNGVSSSAKDIANSDGCVENSGANGSVNAEAKNTEKVPYVIRDATYLHNNVVMIGMPGSGKSTVGKALAEMLGFDFVDGDDILREKSGMSLEEIMNERGPAGFIAYENEVLASVELKHTVFGPGGSIAYEEEAMQHLSENATVVYLSAPREEIGARVGDLQKRGVVLKNGIGMSLDELFAEREPLYRHFADVIIDETGISVQEAAEKTCKTLEKFWEK